MDFAGGIGKPAASPSTFIVSEHLGMSDQRVDVESDDDPVRVDEDCMQVFSEFLSKGALHGECKSIAKNIRNDAKPRDLPSNFILFVHLRHPFSTLGSASAWVARISSQKRGTKALKACFKNKVIKVFIENRKLGLSGLPHVIDALSLAEDCSDYGIFLEIRTDAEDQGPLGHVKGVVVVHAELPHSVVMKFGGWDKKIKKGGIHDFDIVPSLWETSISDTMDIEAEAKISADFEAKISTLYSEVCKKFCIGQSSLSRRAVIFGLFRAWRYTTVFPNKNTYYLSVRSRQQDAFAASVAATIISDGNPRDLVAYLQDRVSFWTTEVNKSEYVNLKNDDRGPADSVVEKIAKGIVDRLHPKNGRDRLRTSLIYATYDFLKLATCFTEEQLEGRALEYGLILSNPMLFRFWPGARPIPLCYRPSGQSTSGKHGADNSRWYTPKEMAEDVHLTAGLRNRCIIVPYNFSEQIRKESWNQEPMPAFSADLSDLSEGVVGWKPWRLWSSTAAIYAYLSHVYPWSVAAMVGPRSEIRVFVKGDLVAFRNGKGWRQRKELTIEALFPNCPENERDSFREGVFQPVVDIALQSSSFARQQQHGGLFLYTKSESVFKGNKVCKDLLDRTVSRICGTPLLNGRLITRKKQTTPPSYEMDYQAARLVRQASQLDGAICLSGTENSELQVNKYAQHVVCNPSKPGKSRGTKRRAGLAFVEHCLMPKSGVADKMSFAVIVSSDGDIRIVTEKSLSQEQLYFEAFVPVQDARTTDNNSN